MNTKEYTLDITNIKIDVVKKGIKNMHLAVYPPEGNIRLTVPHKTDDELVRLFAISKLRWIKKHVKNFQEQAREPEREYISGESHFLRGRRLRLECYENSKKNLVKLNKNILELHTKSKLTIGSKSKLIKEWYRNELKEDVPDLIKKWEDKLGVNSSWLIRQMKTRWGSCNIEDRRITLNLELIKKPKSCLEYIIVHELVHLLERHHTSKFIKHMDEFLPDWRTRRDLLNSLPIVHNDWGY